MLALHTFSSSAAVADMQVCCVASRCAARRRGPLRPFLRSAQWRSLHLMCRLPACTDARRALGAREVTCWRSCPLALCAFASAPAPIGCIDSLSSARCHQLAVIGSQSVGSQSHRLAIQARCHRLQGSARSHLAVISSHSSARSHRLAVVSLQSISSQSSARSPSARSHRLAIQARCHRRRDELAVISQS